MTATAPAKRTCKLCGRTGRLQFITVRATWDHRQAWSQCKNIAACEKRQRNQSTATHGPHHVSWADEKAARDELREALAVNNPLDNIEERWIKNAEIDSTRFDGARARLAEQIIRDARDVLALVNIARVAEDMREWLWREAERDSPPHGWRAREEIIEKTDEAFSQLGIRFNKKKGKRKR